MPITPPIESSLDYLGVPLKGKFIMFTEKWIAEHKNTCASMALVAFFLLIFVGFLWFGMINWIAVFFMFVAITLVPVGYHLDYKELEKKKEEEE